MSVQPNLFDQEPSPEPAPAVRAVPAWVLERERSVVEELVPWGAYVITRERGEQQLARWLARDTAYRAYRCLLCKRAAVVSLGEWRSDRAQVVQCAYRGCSGWVQRDCEPVIADQEPPEEPSEPPDPLYDY